MKAEGSCSPEDDEAVLYDLPLKKILKERRREIVNDLQEDVIDELKDKILNDDEYESIMNQVTVEERAEKLMDILDGKSIQEVAQFVISLKKWYKWLYDLFISLPPCETTSSPPCDLLEEKLTIGGVPPAPPYNIVRKKLLTKIRCGLQKMKGNSFLVLHGMPGIGKSSLAAEALRDPNLVMDVFEGNVIWLSVDGSEGADTMALLRNLNYRLGDERIKDDFNTHPELALIQLKTKYLSSSKKKCLIVLDGVQDPKVIEQLNVGVQYLITTSDLNTVSKNIYSVTNKIKIDDAFNEEESLELFAKVLNVSMNQIFQKEARLIHRQFEGFPLSMSLIADDMAQHREVSLSNKKRWNSYLGKTSYHRWVDYQPVRRLVNSTLETTLKPYFKSFAVFMDGVFLKPEVLSVFWNVDKTKVEEIMVELQNKSLVQRDWNSEQQSYMYGVHPVILEHLKKSLSQQELEDVHKALIQNYMQIALGVRGQLLKDNNYIFHFIGYHLEMAGLFDTFRLFYYNLEFLEAKIRLTDPFDLLRELNNYKKYIVKETESDEDFNSVYEFVENCAHWVLKGIDIAQLALQDSNSRPFIYNKGVNLATKRFNAGKSFVNLPFGSVKTGNTRRVIKLKYEGKVTEIEFANSSDRVVIGCDSGEILLHDLSNNVTITRFVGHKKAVTHLRVSQNGSYFVSTSMDGCVLKWMLTNVKRGTDLFPSPSEIQQNYKTFLTPRLCEDTESYELLAKFDVPCKSVCLQDVNNDEFMAVLTEIKYTDRSTVHVFKNGRNIYNWQKPGLRFCEFFPGISEIALAGDYGMWIACKDTQRLFDNNPVTGLHICPENVFVRGLDSIIKVYTTSDVSDSVSSQSSRLLDSWLPKYLQSSLRYRCKFSHYNSPFFVIGTMENDVVVLDTINDKPICVFGKEQKARLFQAKIRGSVVLAFYEDNTIYSYSVTEENLKPVPYALNWPPWSHYPLSVRCDRPSVVSAYHGTDVLFYRDHNREVSTVSELSDQLGFAFCDREELDCSLVKNKGGRTGTKKIPFKLSETPFKLLCRSIDENGNHIVEACCRKGQVQVWHERNSDVKCDTGKSETQELKGTFDCITADVDPIGNLIVVTRRDIQIWVLADGSFKLRKKYERSMEKVALLASKSQLVQMDSQNSQLLEITGGELIQKAVFPIKNAKLCCFSPDGKQIALLSHDGVLVYDVEKKIYKTHAWPNADCWRSAAVSNTGTVCAVMTNGQVILFPFETEPTSAVVGPSATNVVASPIDPDLFVVADQSGTLLPLELNKSPFEKYPDSSTSAETS